MPEELSATQIREFVDALEREGLTPDLAKLIVENPELAARVVKIANNFRRFSDPRQISLCPS
jgi:HD-like signal output (HDOD) protein